MCFWSERLPTSADRLRPCSSHFLTHSIRSSLYSLSDSFRSSLQSATPFSTCDILSSTLLLVSGVTSLSSTDRSASTSALPSSVDLMLFPVFTAYPLETMSEGKVALVASVPIPWASITPSSSDSVILGGGLVFPSLSLTSRTRNLSPTAILGNGSSATCWYGKTLRKPRLSTLWPLVENSTPPRSIRAPCLVTSASSK